MFTLADAFFLGSIATIVGVIIAVGVIGDLVHKREAMKLVREADHQLLVPVHTNDLGDGRLGYPNSEARKRIENQPEHPCYTPQAEHAH